MNGDEFELGVWLVEEPEVEYGGVSPVPLRERTMEFALRIVRLYSALPDTTQAQVLGKQCLRAGTSIGAHYREGLRARSDAEVISKLQASLQELEETQYWIELLIGAGIIPKERLEPLLQESNELIAILTTCVKRIKHRPRK